MPTTFSAPAHGVEVDGRHPVSKQVPALHGAPFASYAVAGVAVVPVGLDFERQLLGDVDREGLRQQAYLAVAGERLEAWYYGHLDAGGAALVAEIVEAAVVEEHLGDDVVGPGVHLLLQHQDVVLEVRRFEVLLGVGSHSDAEVVLAAEAFLLEAVYGPDELVGVAVASRLGSEALLPRRCSRP